MLDSVNLALNGRWSITPAFYESSSNIAREQMRPTLPGFACRKLLLLLDDNINAIQAIVRTAGSDAKQMYSNGHINLLGDAHADLGKSAECTGPIIKKQQHHFAAASQLNSAEAPCLWLPILLTGCWKSKRGNWFVWRSWRKNIPQTQQGKAEADTAPGAAGCLQRELIIWLI